MVQAVEKMLMTIPALDDPTHQRPMRMMKLEKNGYKESFNQHYRGCGSVAITVGACDAIFLDVLGMKRVVAKFVSNLLNFNQKNRRSS